MTPLLLSHGCAQLQMNGMNGVPPGLAVLGLPPSAMGDSPDFLGGGMQACLVGGLPGGAMGGLTGGAGNAVGLPPGTAALPAACAGAPGMLSGGGSLGAVPHYGSLPLSVGALPCAGLPGTVTESNKAMRQDVQLDGRIAQICMPSWMVCWAVHTICVLLKRGHCR